MNAGRRPKSRFAAGPFERSFSPIHSSGIYTAISQQNDGATMPASMRNLLPPDFFARILERIDVHHPTENHGVERAASFGASFLGEDRPLQAEPGQVGMAALLLGRHAEVGVQVPLRDAERDA